MCTYPLILYPTVLIPSTQKQDLTIVYPQISIHFSIYLPMYVSMFSLTRKKMHVQERNTLNLIQSSHEIAIKMLCLQTMVIETKAPPILLHRVVGTINNTLYKALNLIYNTRVKSSNPTRVIHFLTRSLHIIFPKSYLLFLSACAIIPDHQIFVAI